jgi:titin
VKLADVDETTLEYTHSDPVTPGEEYLWKIKATNSVNDSLLSPSTMIKAATVPDPPAKPTLVDQSTSEIEFSWLVPYDGHDDITDYKVLWDGGQGTSIFTELASSTFGTRSYQTDATLTPGVYYQFKVIAVNSIGQSDPSEAESIIAATAPDAPSEPALVFQDETSIEIAWTANFNGGTPIDDYEVHWKFSTDTEYLNYVLSTGNSLSHEVTTGLDVGEEYDFKVRARNDVGLSPFSAASRFMAAKLPAKPSAPTSSSADRTTIVVDWTAPYNGGTPITNYKVMWNLGGGGTDFFELFTTSDASTFSYTRSGLTTGETYQFKVVAINFIGESEASDILSVIAATVPLQPEAPTKVSADQNQITIRWTAADLATGTTTNFDGGSPTRSFQIYYDASGSFQLLAVHTDLLNL